MLMKTDKNLYECLITSEKTTCEIRENLLVFFINFFMKTLIKSIIDCHTVPLERLFMYVVKLYIRISFFCS